MRVMAGSKPMGHRNAMAELKARVGSKLRAGRRPKVRLKVMDELTEMAGSRGKDDPKLKAGPRPKVG